MFSIIYSICHRELNEVVDKEVNKIINVINSFQSNHNVSKEVDNKLNNIITTQFATRVFKVSSNTPLEVSIKLPINKPFKLSIIFTIVLDD